MDIYDRIKHLRLQRNLSQQELAELVGYKTASAINKIELGLRDINQTKVKKFAEALNTTTNYLINGNVDNDVDVFSIKGITPLPKTKKVPRLGKIACGEPILAEENYDDYDDVPEEIKCDFTLLCKGDSMINARIFDGDIVYIKKQPTVENGEIAAVLIENEATLKRVYFDEKNKVLQLVPENNEYSPLVYCGEKLQEVYIMGKAVAFLSSVK